MTLIFIPQRICQHLDLEIKCWRGQDVTLWFGEQLRKNNLNFAALGVVLHWVINCFADWVQGFLPSFPTFQKCNSINLKRKMVLLWEAYGEWQFEEGHAVLDWAYFLKKGDYISLDLVFLAEILLGHIGAVNWKNGLVQIKECFVKRKPEPFKYIPIVYIVFFLVPQWHYQPINLIKS